MADSDSEAFESADEEIEDKKQKKGELLVRFAFSKILMKSWQFDF